MSKRSKRRILVANALSRNIEYKPAWGELTQLSEEAQEDLVEVLSRVREQGRREGIWEMTEHLGVSRDIFDPERFYHEHGFDWSPELNGELKHRSKDLLHEMATDLALTGVMVLKKNVTQ